MGTPGLTIAIFIHSLPRSTDITATESAGEKKDGHQTTTGTELGSETHLSYSALGYSGLRLHRHKTYQLATVLTKLTPGNLPV